MKGARNQSASVSLSKVKAKKAAPKKAAPKKTKGELDT